MKKLILILLAAALMASCSKKQDAKPTLTPQNATAKDLAGNWLGVVDTAYTTTNGQTTFTVSDNSNGSYFKFNSDNTGVIGTNSPQITNITYTVSAGTLVIHIPDANNPQGEDIDLTILLITADKLIVRSYSGSTHDDIVFIKN